MSLFLAHKHRSRSSICRNIPHQAAAAPPATTQVACFFPSEAIRLLQSKAAGDEAADPCDKEQHCHCRGVVGVFDLVGFTDLFEKCTEKPAEQILGKYFHDFVIVIERHGIDILRIGGDDATCFVRADKTQDIIPALNRFIWAARTLHANRFLRRHRPVVGMKLAISYRAVCFSFLPSQHRFEATGSAISNAWLALTTFKNVKHRGLKYAGSIFVDKGFCTDLFGPESEGAAHAHFLKSSLMGALAMVPFCSGILMYVSPLEEEKHNVHQASLLRVDPKVGIQHNTCFPCSLHDSLFSIDQRVALHKFKFRVFKDTARLHLPMELVCCPICLIYFHDRERFLKRLRYRSYIRYINVSQMPQCVCEDIANERDADNAGFVRTRVASGVKHLSCWKSLCSCFWPFAHPHYFSYWPQFSSSPWFRSSL